MAVKTVDQQAGDKVKAEHVGCYNQPEGAGHDAKADHHYRQLKQNKGPQQDNLYRPDRKRSQ